MNKTYRVIFNHAIGVYQCVSEFAKAKSKTKSVKALTVAVSLVMSGVSFGADIELTDGTTHHYTPNAVINGSVSIKNAGTKVTTDGQILLGNDSNDTTVEVSNQASKPRKYHRHWAWHTSQYHPNA